MPDGQGPGTTLGALLAARRIPGLISRSDAEFVVVFNPETPDRTAAIEGRGPSPLPWLRESAVLLQQMGAAHIAYPCNTAHYFLHRATPDELPLRVPLIDMIDETVRAAAGLGCQRVGLMATSGTIRIRLYQDALAAKGLEMLIPQHPVARPPARFIDDRGRARPEVFAAAGVRPGEPLAPDALAHLVAVLTEAMGEQEGLVMETIVGAHGVKAGYTVGIAPQLAEEAARRLVKRGAEALVLGCTELPLVLRGRKIRILGRSIPLVDPTRVVADRLLALQGAHGIAGGLGPEATVDILEKMNAPSDFTALQRDILQAAVDELGARRDQDHLKMLAIAAGQTMEAGRRLAAAGAGFLVLAPSAASSASTLRLATGLPVLTAIPGQRVGPDVVRLAVQGP
jgi:aspartate/glutamate racemase